MSAGMTMSPEAKTVYEELKQGKYRYIIYHIKDEKLIDVETTGDRSATYADFLEQLQNFKNECRYCVFDFSTEGAAESDMPEDRLVLISWCPGEVKIKQKMQYSSSLDILMTALVGVHKHVQGTNFEEVSQEAIQSALQSSRK